MSGEILFREYSYEEGGYVTPLKVTTWEDADDTPDGAFTDEIHIVIETPSLPSARTIVVHLGDDDILFRGHPEEEESPAALLNHLSNLQAQGETEIIEQILTTWHETKREKYTA